MTEQKKTIVLAAGGTGGHIFPAQTLAMELKNRGYNPILITDNRYENYSDAGEFEFHIIRSSSAEGGLFKRIRGVIDIITGYFQAKRLLAKLKPMVVVGFGGYPSFPTMYAAVRSKLKTIIHEQNSTLGQANYMLAPKVDAIATSFEEVSGIQDNDLGKVVLTGNPVRPMIKVLKDMRYPELSEGGILKILIIGGSQGAAVFSQVVPEALQLLPLKFRRRIRIDQQCRPNDLTQTRALYDKLDISADISTFFNDMPVRLASAHLVICRAGASTLAELTVAGRPALLVPYPRAKNNHQTVNANSLEDVGGGWLIPEEAFTPAALSARLEAFLSLPDTLKKAAHAAQSSGRPDADKHLADLVEKFVNVG